MEVLQARRRTEQWPPGPAEKVMKKERTIDFVGASDEEQAHLRLLLRRASAQTMDSWRLRQEGDPEAELLLVDEHTIVGTSALAAARQRGQRCLRLVDGEAVAPDAVARPLSLAMVVRLLNLSSMALDTPVVETPPAELILGNPYDDLFAADDADGGGSFRPRYDDLPEEPSFDRREPIAEPVRKPAPPPAAVAPRPTAPAPAPATPPLTLSVDLGEAVLRGPEDIFRRDLAKPYKEALKQIRLDDSIRIEATEGLSDRASAKKDRRGGVGPAANTIVSGSHTLSLDEASQSYRLADYLQGSLLPGPSTIRHNEIELTLDPRNRKYHARGSLVVFEDLCREPLLRGAWHGLSSVEFSLLRDRLPPRSYDELLWLAVFLDREHPRAAELDVTVRYWLSSSFDLGRDYPRAARVARELTAGGTIEAAAAAARVGLEEARRVAAAFDVLGWLVRV